MDEEAALNAPSDDAPLAGPSASSSPPSLSKSAQKRAARQARWEATKLDRRAAEKARRKARQQQRLEDLHEGRLDKGEMEQVRQQQKLKRVKQAARRRDMSGQEGDVQPWKGGVIVDCGFDELMTETEVKSMASQLSYIYSTNRLSARPFAQVLFTSFNKRLKERLERVSQGGCTRWARIGLRDAGIETLLPRAAAATGQTTAEESSAEDPFARQTLVYLTADAEDEVTSLREDETYIIGGIVDRNRYKNLCRDKAARLGIRTARLPIGTYLSALPTRKVLTVNQVYDILVRYNECGAWGTAFEKVVPPRKYVAEGKTARRKREKEEGKSGQGVGGDPPGEEPEDDEGEADDEEAADGAGHDTDQEIERLMNEQDGA